MTNDIIPTTQINGTPKNDDSKKTILNNSVIPIWQPQGYSTNHIAKCVGDLFDTKATHTGTLDPMAQGVIVVLTGDQRHKRYLLSDLKKTYTFDVVFGLSTDTFDAMGIITDNNLNCINTSIFNIQSIQQHCNDFIGQYSQNIPVFSAHLHKGKKLFEYGHLQKKIQTPVKKGVIYDFKITKLENKSFFEVVNNIIVQINNVKGNFRQQKIINQYQKLLNNYSRDSKLFIASFVVQTSKGIYIRSLSQDLCKSLSTLGFCNGITRTNNGEYSIENSKSLIDLFGKNYDNILKLP